jgi:site-specific recombinase XerD
VGKNALTERAVWQLVREYAAQIGIGELAPHDLRRYADRRALVSNAERRCLAHRAGQGACAFEVG